MVGSSLRMAIAPSSVYPSAYERRAPFFRLSVRPLSTGWSPRIAICVYRDAGRFFPSPSEKKISSRTREPFRTDSNFHNTNIASRVRVAFNDRPNVKVWGESSIRQQQKPALSTNSTRRGKTNVRFPWRVGATLSIVPTAWRGHGI